MDKVLKIDVVVDESGEASRKLDSIDRKVDGLGEGASRASLPVDRLSRSVSGLGEESGDLGDDLTQTNAALGAGVPLIGGYTAGMLAAGAAAAAFVVAGTGLLMILRTSTEHYIEQSGVLEVNSDAVDRLAASWDRAKFAIGEATLGTSGDFTTWIELVNLGLTVMADKLATGITFWKEMAELASKGPFRAQFDNGAPGADSRLSDINGDETAFGRMIRFFENQKKLREQEHPGFGKGGFDDGMAEWARMDREEREAAQEAERERLRLQRENERAMEANVRMHKQLVDELNRVKTAARDAFDIEIANAYMRQMSGIKGIAADMRDDFASLVLSGRQLKEFQINERAGRAQGNVDDRAENAGELRQSIEAQRELQMLMLRKESGEGAEELHTDLMIFREKYAEVLSGLPATMQTVFQEMTGISTAATTQMAADVETLGQRASATFATMALEIKSAAQLMQEAALLEFDAERNLQRGDPFGIGWFQRQAANEKRRLAGEAGFREAVLGFAAGGIVPRYFATGGLARGSDTVHAMLTPGEGVLSTRGMQAFDRLNRGMGMGSVTVTVDARGATIDSPARVRELAETIQRTMRAEYERVGA